MIGQTIVLECGQDFLYNERSKICCILCSAVHDALSEPAVFELKETTSNPLARITADECYEKSYSVKFDR
jgi:hypothetical protein